MARLKSGSYFSFSSYSNVSPFFLAEFFIQSLNVWAEDVDQKKFVIEILRQWRVLHEQYEKEHDQTSQPELAVAPSEVFGLRRMKGPDI